MLFIVSEAESIFFSSPEEKKMRPTAVENCEEQVRRSREGELGFPGHGKSQFGTRRRRSCDDVPEEERSLISDALGEQPRVSGIKRRDDRGAQPPLGGEHEAAFRRRPPA